MDTTTSDTLRDREDDSLAIAAIRDAVPKAVQQTTSGLLGLVSAVLAASILMGNHQPLLAVYISIFGPFVACLGYRVWAHILSIHAQRMERQRQLWDRHRTTLVLKRIADRKDVL